MTPAGGQLPALKGTSTGPPPAVVDATAAAAAAAAATPLSSALDEPPVAPPPAAPPPAPGVADATSEATVAGLFSGKEGEDWRVQRCPQQARRSTEEGGEEGRDILENL